MGKKVEKLLSFDCSTTCTGLAYWENKQLIESHIIDFRKLKDSDERCKQMAEMIWKALEYYKPSIVVMEDTYYSRNPDGYKKLNRLQGIIWGWCIGHKKEFNILMPSAWRKYIPDCPNGRSAKRDEQKAFAIKYVAKQYKVKAKTDDEAESILIGEALLRKQTG